MNGIHDLGGMHGMGPTQPEKNEPVFHADWEARVFALTRAMGAWRKWNIDASRHQRELIPAAEYLRMSYYEKWLTGLEELIVKSGLVEGPKQANPALKASEVAGVLARGSSARRDVEVEPSFTVGQQVRARNL